MRGVAWSRLDGRSEPKQSWQHSSLSYLLILNKLATLNGAASVILLGNAAFSVQLAVVVEFIVGPGSRDSLSRSLSVYVPRTRSGLPSDDMRQWVKSAG